MRQSLKLVIAIVKPFKLDDEALSALKRAGCCKVAITETKDYDRHGRTAFYIGAGNVPDLVPMLRLEAAVPGDQVENVTEFIMRAAETSDGGNEGNIFVFSLDRMVSIGTEIGRVTPLWEA